MNPEEIEQAKLAKEAEEAAAVAEQAAKESVYKQELAKLQAEKDKAEEDKLKAEEIAEQKSGAIKEEREKRKAAEAAAKALAESSQVSEEELDKKLEAKLNARDFTQRLKSVSQDPDEQNLIKHHYETSIVKTGNVETDLARAVAIANTHLIDQARQAQIEREEQETRTMGYQKGNPKAPKGTPAYETDPTLRGAASLLDRWGRGDSKKFLGK